MSDITTRSLFDWSDQNTGTGQSVMLASMQPAAGFDRPLRWGRVVNGWKNNPANGSYADCYPASSSLGDIYDLTRKFRVYLPRSGGCDPNLVGGQVIAYALCDDGSHVALSGYLDAAIGTIRMWSPNSGDPPQGWTECIPGGTSGRATPTVQRLDGRFPIGRDSTDDDYDTTGAYSDGAGTAHSHQIAREMTDPDWQHSIYIEEGNSNSTLFTVLEADNMPPWCVVRFIERYDNSI